MVSVPISGKGLAGEECLPGYKTAKEVKAQSLTPGWEGGTIPQQKEKGLEGDPAESS